MDCHCTGTRDSTRRTAGESNRRVATMPSPLGRPRIFNVRQVDQGQVLGENPYRYHTRRQAETPTELLVVEEREDPDSLSMTLRETTSFILELWLPIVEPAPDASLRTTTTTCTANGTNCDAAGKETQISNPWKRWSRLEPWRRRASPSRHWANTRVMEQFSRGLSSRQWQSEGLTMLLGRVHECHDISLRRPPGSEQRDTR